MAPVGPRKSAERGERFDDASGLQYLNARYYDPKLAMFVQPDWWEVTKPGVGTNRYSYGFGDPVNAKDPSGHDAVGYEGHYGGYPTFQENTWTENRFLRALDNTARTILNTPSSVGNLFADGIYGVGELLAPHEGALVNLAMTTPTATDDIGAVTVSKFARLSAALSEKAALRTTAINPNRLRFSQTSAGGGNPPRALAYREQMQGGNWGGPPIDVVRTESGSLVVIDNTRLAIAQELGFRRVPVRVHAMGEALPEGMAGQRGWGGSKTWGDALKVRTSDNKLPIDGTSARPRMSGTANTSSASGGGLGGFLSRLFGGYCMSELPQKFIIDFLIERNLQVPNLFHSPEFAQHMKDTGFKFPYQPDYVSTVDAVNKRYPNRYVVPFGHRVGDDDIIAFVYSPEGLGTVVLFHGWTSPGNENPTYYPSLSDWIDGEDYYDVSM